MKASIWVKVLLNLLVAAFYSTGSAAYEEGVRSPEELPKPLGLKFSTPRKPSITEHPSSTVVQGSDVVRLDCRADGYPEPTISWRRNSAPLRHIKDRGIVEMNPGGLVIISTSNRGKWPNTGIYQCIATNRLGTVVSRNASVQIASIRDDFRREPIDTIAAVGKAATIQCEGPRGIPEPIISWKKDSQPLRNSSRVQINPSGDLYISRLEMSDSGSYECVASNIAGVKTSQSAHLMVQEPPRVTVSPTNLLVREGESVDVVCQVDGNPLPRIWWSKMRGSLSDRFTSSTDGSMRIDGVEMDDGGEYVCTAENRVGRVSGSVVITVQTEPLITKVTPDTTVQVGETVTLPCRAEGNPQPTIYWRDFHGNEMFVEKSYQDGHVLIDANGDLVLFSARLNDAGVYRCQALNTIGTATADVHLKVEPSRSRGPPPQLYRVPSNTTAPLKSTVTLECSSVGNPRPVIEWLKENKPVDTSLNWPRTTILNSGSLKISNLQSVDAGQYTCRASNNYGITKWRAWIKVGSAILDRVELPPVPGKPMFINSTSSTITLSWTPSRLDSLTEHYIIEYYRVESSSGSWKQITPVIQSVHKVTNLLPSSNYVFSIRSANRGGVSGPSPNSEYMRTKDPATSNPSVEDSSLVAVSVLLTNAYKSDTDSSTLTWESNSGCDVINGFMVIAQATTSSKKSITEQATCNSRSAQLVGLEKGRKYEVRIRPLKGLRVGPASPIVFVSLDEGIVAPKLPLLSFEVIENKVTFQWQHPSDLPATYVTGYALRCRTQDGAVDRILHVNASTKQLTLDDLQSDVTYYATLTYSTQLGVGTSSNEETIVVGGHPADLAAILGQPAVIAGIAAALLVIIVVIFAVCWCKKRKRASKTRGHGSRRGDLNNFGKSFVMTPNQHEQQSGRNIPLTDAGMYPSEQMPMMASSAANPFNSNSSVSYNAKNGDITSNIANNPQGVAIVPPQNFSYVNDQLTNKNDIHPHFSRPVVSSPQQISAYQPQRQPHPFDRQQSAYNNTNNPQDDKNNGNVYIESSNIRHDALPPPPSPPLSHRTGISDKSRSSSGIRSTSDRSNKSGQSSRRQVAATGIVNNRAPPHATEATNRLHGSQHAFEHGYQDEASNFAPPTPPIREESFHDYGSSETHYNRDPHSNAKLNRDAVPKLSSNVYPASYNQPRSNAKAIRVSLGNGYGSESDVRESSCEHDSTPSYSSDDESVDMESASQVGQNPVPRNAERSRLYSPLASQSSSVFPHPTCAQYNNDQDPLLPEATGQRSPLEAPSCSKAPEFGNVYPNSASATTSKEAEPLIQNQSLNSNESPDSSCGRTEFNPRNARITSTEMPTRSLASNSQQTRQIENSPALKLDIGNTLNELLIQNGDYHSPSSPTESAVSDLSGYMSTASSCWQFHLSSPTKTSSQLRNAKINSNGRLPSLQRADKQHLDFNNGANQSLVSKNPKNLSSSNYASTPNSFHNGLSQFQNAKLGLAGKLNNTYPNERPETRTQHPITTISEFSEDPNI